MSQHVAESTWEYPIKSPHLPHGCHHQFIVSTILIKKQVDRAVTEVSDLTTEMA